MPYVEGRTIHDADSHVMETPEWFQQYADPAVRDKMAPLYVSTVKPGEDDFIEEFRQFSRTHRSVDWARLTQGAWQVALTCTSEH